MIQTIIKFKEVITISLTIMQESYIDTSTSNYLPPMTPNTKLFNASGDGDINYRDGTMPFSPNAERRNFYNRAFGKLGKGSLRGSIFALCASAIGSGVLSLPYVLGLNGWLLGLIFILVGGFCKSLFLNFIQPLDGVFL
jgi:hypothetical protein